jgi:hypothetical protein
MKKEQWKEEVLNSLEGIQRATPDTNLYNRIRAKVIAGQKRVVRRSYVAMAAACLVVLVASNVWVLAQRKVEMQASSPYQVDNANFDLY